MATPFRALLVTGAFIWLSGCAVGPDYELPAVVVPEVFVTASLTPAVPSAPTTADFVRWWQVLHDPRLNALIEGAKEREEWRHHSGRCWSPAHSFGSPDVPSVRTTNFPQSPFRRSSERHR